MIEKAARALGGGQVGFTTLKPEYLWAKASYPPQMRYVIVLLTEWSAEGIKRADSGVGLMANRVQTVREQIAFWGLRNFIEGLGYDQSGLAGPSPAYGVFAGLGELGRMNRLVSPIYGPAVNVMAIVTDLPLAVDRPIDFGLQKFCRRCRRCAEVCPVGAVSRAPEPTWEVAGEWNTPGKKAYYEKSVACAEYQFRRNTSCSLCLAACPWTKQDICVLHRIARPLSARLPSAARLMVMLDKFFGYGPTRNPAKLEQWWDLDLPLYGIDSTRTQR